ncbi:MAG TPA: biotin--[acetyl-CoA-carboxylase] ligase [Terracidiphilus sp.]|nr:biotin--[acetyl-CoA-carboxylase] ligase [Terracidiphilus sp.]
MHSMIQPVFDLPALDAALAGTIFAGKLHFSPVTDSTNTDALDAARRGAPHGSVYLADEQLAGRGRGDNVWRSDAGEGLYVSVLLRPQIPAARLPLLPLAAGLAAADAICAVAGLTVDLRWPNDLLIGPRKAGGILVEARTEGSTVAFAVIGIGINVHQRSFDSGLSPQRPGPVAGDPGLATPATSLDLETGHQVSRQDLLVSLLKSLERETLALLDPAAGKTITQRAEQASMWVRGRRVEVHGPQACTGVTAGLDEHGFLLVRTAAGLVTVQTGGIRAAEMS